MRRNASIEVFRCVLMFGIVLLHCCSQGPLKIMAPYRLCMSCVTGFVFISGYFGIRFSWGKVLSLILTAVVCAAISFAGEQVLHLSPCGFSFYEYLVTGNWFLWAYVVLMMFSPLLERALSADGGKDAWRWAAPLLFVVFGWNFLSGMPVVGKWFPRPVGFGTHTFLMMIGVYLAARLFRHYDLERLLVGWKLGAVVLFGGLLCAAGLSHYDSPVSFVFMAASFVGLKRLSMGWIGRVAVVLAPSIFSVYLLHWSPLGLKFLVWAESRGLQILDGKWSFVIAVSVAIVLFVGGAVFDLPRRVLWQLVRTHNQRS